MRFSLLLLWFVTASILAKPIDIQKISKKQGFTGQTEGSFQYQSGFTQRAQLSSEIAVQYMKNENLTLGIFEGEVNKETNGNGTNEDYRNLQHFRYRKFNSQKWGLESFIQREEDTERNLSLGYVYGAGPFRRIYNKDTMNLTAGVALVQEYENRRVDGEQTASRLYNYLSLGVQASKQLTFGTTLHTEPKISDSSDYRIFTRSSAKYQLRNNVTLGFRTDSTFDTDPATNVPKVDRRASMTIGVQF